MIILLAALLLAATFGSDPVQAQGHVICVPPPTVTGTLGNNGWYTSDVTVYWDTSAFDSTWKIIQGCADINTPEVIDYDTTADGVLVACIVEDLIGNQGGSGGYIKRDATPPVLNLVSPIDPKVSVEEGSTLLLEAVAQDLNLVTVGWDLDEDGTIDAPNPTSITIPGNIAGGGPSPWFIVTATDEAGNVSQIEVEVNIINLPPNIDGWVVPSMLHFGGEVQLEASTSDPGGDPLTARVDWGDNQLEEVVVKPDSSIQAAHTYAGAGTFPVTLILSDDEGPTVSDSKDVWIYTPARASKSTSSPAHRPIVSCTTSPAGSATRWWSS